jgi:protein-L-isoaspartate O-methyltransferase
MVIPVGSQEEGQVLRVLTKEEDGLVIVSDVIPVRFVPLTRDEELGPETPDSAIYAGVAICAPALRYS